MDDAPDLACIVFATSRAHSKKISATGLIVRFFNVVIVTGHGGIGSSTGSALNARRCGLNFSIEPGKIDR